MSLLSEFLLNLKQWQLPQGQVITRLSRTISIVGLCP